MRFEPFSIFCQMGISDDVETADLLLKARDVATPEPLRGRIGGLVSTESQDHQGETVFRDGMDFGYFLKHGWFNWEHQPGPENVLGEPTGLSQVTTPEGIPATSVDGFLYLGRPRAAAVYETVHAMRKAQTARAMGYSVEGQVLFRNPKNRKHVLKSRVLNVAITAHPINPDARLEALAKAATIGYQTPSSGGGSMGALVPQSIDRTALTQLGFEMARTPGVSVDEFAVRLASQYRIPVGSARKIADSIARHIRHS